jgi:hypothetical protein
MRRLSFLDRGRGLFGRSRRQRGRSTCLLRLGIGPCGLRRNLAWPRTGRGWLGRCGRFGFCAWRRLQRLRRLRHLRIVGCELHHREAKYGKPHRNHRGGEQHILPVSTFPVVGRHILHRVSLAGSTDRRAHCSLGNGPGFPGGILPKTSPVTPSFVGRRIESCQRSLQFLRAAD